ncbi:dimethylamine monooxygenase subunit DmmA family protein [Oceanobacillus sp. FSL K6-2867]|uniref:dimethylamine monooxygenase subunit DmmA family protein n=1 Tax=Oceanobacillus sp. FSL K6-2867 TaxID=2954748 RepID=UPI0030DD9E84
MRTVKCKLIKQETLNQGHVVEVELVEGSIPNLINYSDQVKWNETIVNLPTYVIQTNKKGVYRLYFNTSSINEASLFNFDGNLFELVISEYSQFNIPDNCKKMLLLIEDLALFESLVIIDFLSINKIEANVYVKGQEQGNLFNYLQRKVNDSITLLPYLGERELQSIFNKQVIGTRLYIAGSWSMINDVKNIAHGTGFTDDEIQFKGLGVKKEKIMCIQCYSFNTNETEEEIEEMKCVHCDALLEVSDHYSKRLGAYLGYVQLQEAPVGVGGGK